MKTKTKRKTIITSSAIFIFLMLLSFSSTTVNAADDPIMTVDFVSNYTILDLPIEITVLFEWDTPNLQALMSVHIFYSVNSITVDGTTFVAYFKSSISDVNPLEVDFEIPSANLQPGDIVRFRVESVWRSVGWVNHDLIDPTKHVIRIQDATWEGELQIGMIIGISVGSGVLLIALGYYWFKRRRK